MLCCSTVCCLHSDSTNYYFLQILCHSFLGNAHWFDGVDYVTSVHLKLFKFLLSTFTVKFQVDQSRSLSLLTFALILSLPVFPYEVVPSTVSPSCNSGASTPLFYSWLDARNHPLNYHRLRGYIHLTWRLIELTRVSYP